MIDWLVGWLNDWLTKHSTNRQTKLPTYTSTGSHKQIKLLRDRNTVQCTNILYILTDRHKEKVFIETLYQFGTSSVQISHLLTQKWHDLCDDIHFHSMTTDLIRRPFLVTVVPKKKQKYQNLFTYSKPRTLEK